MTVLAIYLTFSLHDADSGMIVHVVMHGCIGRSDATAHRPRRLNGGQVASDQGSPEVAPGCKSAA
ncbi:MAG: hypothetical protein IH867_07305 [Chloroflexi bacterium]|nr:hypothetical protein [Chloroflexota bacterium]